MAKIIAIHGIGQQFKGDAIIHREWWPAFLSGLHLAGGDLSDPDQFVCPFYGHVFRSAGTLALTDHWQAKDVAAEEAELIERLSNAAAQAEPDSVPALAEADGVGLARIPRMVQNALNVLSKSRFWANISQAAMIGDLKQVIRYLNDGDLHEQILQIILDRIASDTKVVIGHSLGSVVAYEALCRKPEAVAAFISLGSPLGIRTLIFDKLTPRPSPAAIGVWPGRVKHWTNIADRGDIVALQKKLAPLFGDQVKDILVCNGSEAHHGERYLTTKEVGKAACIGLWGRSS